MKAYFDNASTTPLLAEVKLAMKEVIDNNYGNPSSIHSLGRSSKILIEDARSDMAQGIRASTGEIFFTSGATEANNMALLCSVRDLGVKTIISSPTEHHCILHTLDYISNHGLANVRYLKVNEEGHIDYEELTETIRSSAGNVLVSLMHANNEIGSIHDIDRIAAICQEEKALFHTDTAQTIGKLKIDVQKTKIAFLSGSAHKFFGPKGSGFIYINNDNMIQPLLYGGDQERGLRSGTENLFGIVGMHKAFVLAMDEMEERHEKTLKIKTYCQEKLRSNFSNIKINGSKSAALYNILSVSFPPSNKAEMLIMNLDIAGICASAGSACSSGVENDSHVLQHIGHDPQRKTIRFSFSHFNTIQEIDFLIEKLGQLLPS